MELFLINCVSSAHSYMVLVFKICRHVIISDVYSAGHTTLLWKKFCVNFAEDSTAPSWHASSRVWFTPLKVFVDLVLWVRG